jgi:hypothetical protein
MAPLSSCTVTVGAECLLFFLVVMVLPGGMVAAAAPGEEGPASSAALGSLPGPGPWSAHSDAATAHWRRRALAGRLLAWARRFPAGVVSMAEWMCGERLARRKDVTRFVRRSGGGGGIAMVRDILAGCDGR